MPSFFPMRVQKLIRLNKQHWFIWKPICALQGVSCEVHWNVRILTEETDDSRFQSVCNMKHHISMKKLNSPERQEWTNKKNAGHNSFSGCLNRLTDYIFCKYQQDHVSLITWNVILSFLVSVFILLVLFKC